MKTAELAGALLDYWVGNAQGERVVIERNAIHNADPVRDMCCWPLPEGSDVPDFSLPPYRPSRNLELGRKIIEQKGISVAFDRDRWVAGTDGGFSSSGVLELHHMHFGETGLIAAMRVCVELAYGPEVPEILHSYQRVR